MRLQIRPRLRPLSGLIVPQRSPNAKVAYVPVCVHSRAGSRAKCLIAASKKLTHVHADLSVWERGYSLESDLEVDVENDEYEFRQDDEILTFFGYPYLPAI